MTISVGRHFLMANIDGWQWRCVCTGNRQVDRQWRPSNKKHCSAMFFPLTADIDGRLCRLSWHITHCQCRPSNKKALQCNAFSFDGRHWRYVCTGNRQWRPTNHAIFSKKWPWLITYLLLFYNEV